MIITTTRGITQDIFIVIIYLTRDILCFLGTTLPALQLVGVNGGIMIHIGLITTGGIGIGGIDIIGIHIGIFQHGIIIHGGIGRR